VNFRRQKCSDEDRDGETLDLAEARRALLEARAENTRLRFELQQLRVGVRADEDVIAP
jgi:hypothetical protein